MDVQQEAAEASRPFYVADKIEGRAARRVAFEQGFMTEAARQGVLL